jgi:hypothetical protein
MPDLQGRKDPLACPGFAGRADNAALTPIPGVATALLRDHPPRFAQYDAAPLRPLA